jgi:MFS family permease
MMGDGMAFSFMVGAGESYLPAFALALGLGDVTAGLVATIPMLAGALLQLATPFVVSRLGSHRRWVVGCAALQALSFVPLVSGAVIGWLPAGGLFFAASLYWGFGMATGPAWNTWAGTIVPKPLRPRYFAVRARWSQVALVVGLAAAGWWLEMGSRSDDRVRFFAVVFAAAMLARLLSATLLARQSEPLPVPIGDTRITPGALREDLLGGGHGKLLLYLLVFQLAVWVVAPYFTPYMLGPLELSYLEFMLLTGAAFVARIALMPWLGHFAHVYGTRRLLWLGSIGIVPLPAMWLVSEHFAWLLFLQVLGGFAWGAFELATLLSFFEHIPIERRTALLSVYNVANAVAIVAGGAIGGVLLGGAGVAGAGYTLLLVGSTVLRALALPLLRGAADSHPPAVPPPLRTLTVRPSSGGLQRPVLPGMVEQAGAD